TFFLHEALGVDPFLSIPLSMAAMFACGWVIQRVLINQIVRAPILATFLLTFGLEILIVNLATYFFKADQRSVTTAYSGAGFSLGPARVPFIRVGALAVAVALVLATAWFLKSTRAGRAIRATGMDIDAARLTGVKVAKIYALTFAIGAALAGASGSLLSALVPFDPNLGGTYTRDAFVICVLGGLGTVSNVLLGATLMGFVDVLVGARFPALSQAVTFVVLVLVLVVRPQGIAGKQFYAS